MGVLSTSRNASNRQLYSKLRAKMVSEQIKARDFRDKNVLRAMEKVAREEFVPDEMKTLAYEDRPLLIGEGQTISQPYMVAIMTKALQLKGGERVLEIGTGSGYSAAILAEIAAEVYSIERHASLAVRAEKTLRRLNYTNINIITGDGTMGLPGYAPFEAIAVTAGAPHIPQSLKAQLSIGGRLVIPVGEGEDLQWLSRITRTREHEYKEQILGLCRFVPLIGEEGWHEDHGNNDKGICP